MDVSIPQAVTPSCGVVAYDPDGRIITADRAFRELISADTDDTVPELFTIDDWEGHWATVEKAEGSPVCKNRTLDDTDLRLKFFPISSESEVQLLITQPDDDIELNYRAFKQVIEQVSHVIFWTDHSGTIEYVNPAFEEYTGYSFEEAVGERPSILQSGYHNDAFYRELWSTIKGGDVWEGQIINRRKDGETFEAHQTIAPIKNSSGEITRFVSIQDKPSDEEWRFQALHDSLTGLPNRDLFRDRLEQVLENDRTETTGAVVFLDLDNFKDINDEYDHMAGDKTLKSIAKRLQGALRPGDTVARYGGDEFLVLIQDVSTTGEAESVIERLYERLTDPVQVQDEKIRITASSGYTMVQTDDDSPMKLIERADRAMYRAKDEPGLTHRQYDPSTDD